MTKLTTKFLLAGAVAAVALAMSVAPSEAAKRRMAASKACTAGSLCSTNCSAGWCSVYVCGGDAKWYSAVLTPICPQGNCVNVKKKC